MLNPQDALLSVRSPKKKRITHTQKTQSLLLLAGHTCVAKSALRCVRHRALGDPLEVQPKSLP